MEIKSKNELKDILSFEKQQYFKDGKITCEIKYRQSVNYQIYKYIYYLRKYEYYCYRRDNSSNPVLAKLWSFKVKKADRKKNKSGSSACVEITPNFVDKGVRICHRNVVINGIVGENCVFHGNNVIGNKKTGAKDLVPHIGRNVDVGTGATIIGDITIADKCIIGAGAVVTRSFETPGSVVVGVPAKCINN
ncbi:MAG: hypothetical protein IJU04_06555 [Ruminococcus sp.]|nr:hypothetical protein [Ruminococcus sp.]